MSKISKNIKKLRNENGLTQDALAQKIHVTRQTVSGWENGRTQPDIDMLELLADAFSVGIETIIYGEKNNVGLEPPKSDRRKILNIVFSTLGSLLTAAGVIIVLVSFWDAFPPFFINILSFVPLLVGGFIAARVYRKNKNSIGRCEGASVAWVIGLVTSFALIVSTFGVELGFEFSAAALSLMILPMAHIMDSVFPLATYFAVVTFLTSSSAFSQLDIFSVLLGTALFFIGIIRVIKTPKGDYKHTYSVYIALISASLILVCLSFGTTELPMPALFCSLMAILTALYAADKEDDSKYSFRFFAVPAISIILVVLCWGADEWLSEFSASHESGLVFTGIAPFVSVAAIVGGIFRGRKNLSKNYAKIAFICISSLVCFVCILNCVFAKYDRITDITKISVIACALAMSIIIIVIGIKKMKLLTVNLGLFMLCVVIFLTYIIGNFEPVFCGIACIVMGVILLFINFRLSKTFKAKESEQNA